MREAFYEFGLAGYGAASFGRLEKDIQTDVLVIGGGMAGLLCTYLLTHASVDCALAEAETLCGGVTKNTTAKITSQHGLIYDGLIRCFGEEKALLYLFDFEERIPMFIPKATRKSSKEIFRPCGGWDFPPNTSNASRCPFRPRAQ